MEYKEMPKDPMILLSYVNTQLRDSYTSFNDFCLAKNISEQEISHKLEQVDYTYDSVRNQFV